VTNTGETTFTVFTATFNRRHLLGRAYRSLCSQTFWDFEWLIIDDGSTDATESLVTEWMNERRLVIRYFYQPNQGRHRAFNDAIERARGQFFTMLDSDDALVPGALERLLYHWNSIPPSRRNDFSGVTCLCMDETGRLIGRPFPDAVLDCRHFEADTRYRARGEKWGFHRTSVLKQFPFPQIANERFCPEALVWNRIALQFKVRHVNELLKTYYTHKENLTAIVDQLRIRNPRSATFYYREYLDLELPLRYKLKKIVNYMRFSLHSGGRWREVIARAPVRGIGVLLYPLGWAVFFMDRLRFRKVFNP
jgi:glycosyltransferase involved in cell wall biosynthesis